MAESFSYEQKVAMTIPYVQKAIREGVSKTSLYNQLKGTAIGMRKTDFLKVFDAVRMMEERGGLLVTNWQLKKPALYRFEVTYQHVKTGEEKKQVFSLYSDEPIPASHAVKRMEGVLQTEKEKYARTYDLGGFNLAKITPVTPVFRAEVAPRWAKALAQVYAKRS